MVTAITLTLAVLAGAAAYGLWAAVAIARGASAFWFIAGVPIAALAVPALLSAVWFAHTWRFRAERPHDARIGLAKLPGLYARELAAIAGSVPRMILYRWLMRDPAPAPAAAPVLLLHGVVCNAGVWHAMKKFLAARGIGPIYALSYGPPLASIEHFAEQAAKRIDAILEATGARQVTIVAHSMGGLVARAYLRRYGRAKVRRLITIGTPHHGSALARMFPGAALAQMRPGSAWLEELNAAEASGPPPVVSIWSWHDSMVAPQTSSVLAGKKNVALSGIAHNALLHDSRVWEIVAREITSE